MLKKLINKIKEDNEKSYKEMAYRYSKKRIEEIDAIDLEIKRCDKGIEKTLIADSFTCSCLSKGIEYNYKVQTDMMRRVVKVGLEAYKNELINKRNKLME